MEGYVIYTYLKNINQTWWFEATEFKFYRYDSDSGRYVSI